MSINTENADLQAKSANGLLEILKTGLQRLFRNPVEREQEFYRRLGELNDAIERTPDAMTCYVLRGDLLVEQSDYARALADYQAALELAENMDSNQGWGLLEQTMRDRALQGIDFVAQHI